MTYGILQFVLTLIVVVFACKINYDKGKKHGIDIGREQILKENLKRLNVRGF